MITLAMVQAGYDEGHIKLIESPHSDGIACQIGDNWFYFGGQTAEEYKDVESYKNDILKEDIIKDIFEVLEDFATELEDEYLYYDYYLRTQIEKNVFTEAPHGRFRPQIISEAPVDEQDTIYTVSLEPGYMVDVKACEETGLVYVMQNQHGNSVYGVAGPDAAFRNYYFDEDMIVELVKEHHKSKSKEEVYGFECGVLLSPGDAEFRFYANNNPSLPYGFYDENQHLFLKGSLDKNLDYLREYVKAGVDKTYAIISRQGEVDIGSDEYAELVNGDPDIGGMSYSYFKNVNEVVWSLCKMNGKLIEGFLEKEIFNAGLVGLNIHEAARKLSGDFYILEDSSVNQNGGQYVFVKPPDRRIQLTTDKDNKVAVVRGGYRPTLDSVISGAGKKVRRGSGTESLNIEGEYEKER